ncbi:hypothetical protein vB_PsyM_KIL5_0021 [Pseudomonas phage vB_PsyM_KIL5]|nr:hypothetical protein vB_PsyM_KIL5_0021 [Pseudomonas phage vB_PsyM_KIL5]
MTVEKDFEILDTSVMTVEKDFEILDTSVVQVRSVLNFMYALGYNLDTEGRPGRFVTEQKVFQGNRYLSFSTACKMHNLKLDDWSIDENSIAWPSCTPVKEGFSVLGVKLAEASKLVKRVKLSVSKHGQVMTLDPMIRPLNKTVEGLLGL